LTGAPAFSGVGPHPYQLTAASPGLDTASNAYGVYYDRLKNARPAGAGLDMGAYELGAAPAPPFTGGTCYVDFNESNGTTGNAAAQDPTRNWHVMNGNGTIANLEVEGNQPTGYSLTVSGFSDSGTYSNPGGNTWTDVAPWVVDATSGDYLYLSGTTARTVTLSNLDPDNLYTIELVASRYSSGNRKGTYVVTDLNGLHDSDNLRPDTTPWSQNFDAYTDGALANELMVWSGLVPDANNEILLTLTCGGNYAYISGMRLIIEVPADVVPIPEPAGLSLLGLVMLGLRRRRR
jgi:hypothetical protein